MTKILSDPRLRSLLLPILGSLWLAGGVIADASPWRSTLYPETWTPPENASFATDKLIQDFSYAGYKRGEEPIPAIASPVFDVTAYGADAGGAGDSTVAIQNAINAAAVAGGGVVFLPSGTFRVSPQGTNNYALRISTSNIVLRGAGTAVTFLLNTSTSMTDKAVIQVSPPSTSLGTTRNITADLPGPTRRIPVTNAGSFAPGNIVRLQWEFTNEWITENNQQTWWNDTNGRPSNATYFREVTATNSTEGWIEVDVPTRYAMKTRDTATVRTISGQLTHVGIESLAIGNLQHPGSQWGESDYEVAGTSASDTHASWLVRFTNVRDSWMSSVHSRQAASNTRTCHMLSNGISLSNCLRVTVENCQMRRPQYGGGGGNGYMYRIQTSNDCLVKNSLAEFSRHGFVVSHAGTSGNVFLQCEDRDTQRAIGSSSSGYTTSGSGSDNHMHFSHSNLWDQCHAHNSFFTAHHRTTSGTTPHGLTSAHAVYWNTTGSGTRYNDIVRSEQLHYGYVIGTSGSKNGATNPTGGNTAPADHLEGIGLGANIAAPSLYLDQLAKRMQGVLVLMEEETTVAPTSAHPVNASIYTYGSGPVVSQWSQISGPATAVFADASSPVTTVSLPEMGTYVLELGATQGTKGGSAQVVIRVGAVASASLSHYIRGESQDTATRPLGYFISASNIVGTWGSNGSREDRNLVLGYTLPTLPVRSTLASATFRFEITQAYDTTGAANLPDLHVYLLDAVNPAGSGTGFFYHGASDSDANVKRIGTTSVSISGTGANDFAPGEQVRTFTLTGEVLNLLRSYYTGPVPTRSTVYFRFNLGVDPAVTGLRRYIINTAAGASSLGLLPTAPAATYSVTYHVNGATSGTAPAGQTKTHDEDLTLATNSGNLARGGHAFVGWNTAADGSGVDYAEGASYTGNAALTLYAKWNDNPAVYAGPEQTVTLNQLTPWTPADITTAAWYDATDVSSGAVSQWSDKSGNNHHATQGTAAVRPTSGTATIGGLNTLSFRVGDGTNKQFLAAPDHPNLNLDSSGGANIFSVFRHLGFVNNGSTGLNSPLSKGQMLGADSAYGIRVGSNQAVGFKAGTDILVSASSSANQTLLFSGTRNDITRTGSIHLNGTLATSATKATAILSDNTSPLYFGRDASTGRYASVDFGEILIVGGTLADTDRQRIEGYLAHKWQLVGNLPETHPYKATAPGELFASASLDGTATDAENDPLSFTWSVVSGPGTVTFANPTAADSSATFSSVGTYVLRLTVNDGFSTASDEVSITVRNPVVEPKTYDVYFVAGQSNAEGLGYNSDLTGTLASYAGPQPGVKIFYVNPTNQDPLNPAYNTGWTTLAPVFGTPVGFGSIPSNRFGFELSLGKALAARDPSRNVAIIKVTRGGTSLSTNWDPAGGDNFMWQTFANKVPEALAALTANGDTVNLRAMFWHQGESDGDNPTYQSDLVEFIAAVRSLVGTPTLPFAMGELERDGDTLTVKGRSYQQTTMANVADADPNAIVVSSADLVTMDGTHFTSPSYITLGERFAQAFHDFEQGLNHSVTYDGNDSTGGTVPVDSRSYNSVASATVPGAGSLIKSGFNFYSWNTAADGSGTSYPPGSVFVITADTTLYAQWTPKQTPLINSWPAAATITEGQPLSAATLSGGNASVSGSFSYPDPSTVPPAGEYVAAVIFTPDDMATYNPVQDTVNVAVQTAFDSWAGEGVTFTGDANSDGVADGLAWLLGVGSTAAAANGLLPTASGSNGDLTLSFKLRKPASQGSSRLKLQYSRDLGLTDPWTSHTVTIPDVSGADPGGVVFVIAPVAGQDYDEVQATIPSPAAGGTGKVFVRLSGALSNP